MKVGLIGTGTMAEVHAKAWRVAGAEVTAVYSRTFDATQRFAAVHGAQACTNTDQLFEHSDLVDVCTPTWTHPELVLAAARAGKNVVCEKPIALTLNGARAMVAACEQAGVRLFIAQVLRFFPQYQAAQKAIQAGQIGDLGVMRLKRVAYPPAKPDNWYFDEAKSGGMVLDLMIHDFDFARWVAGEVLRVHAKSMRATNLALHKDYALVTLEFASGAIAQIEGGWAYPAGVFRTGFDIAARFGVLEWTSDQSNTLTSFVESAETQAAEVGLPLSILAEDPYVTQIKHVLASLETGRDFLVSPEDAIQALRIALAAKRSLETGRAVPLTEVA